MTASVIESPSGSESLTSTGTGVGTSRRSRTASGRTTGGRLGSPTRATSTRTSTSSPTAPSASMGRYVKIAVPSKPSVGANRSAGRPEGPIVSVTSPSVASPTLCGGENPPRRNASRSGSTSLSSTSTITGTPGPVSTASATPTGALFVDPGASSSMITDADAAVPLPSTIVYSNSSMPTYPGSGV